MSRPGPGDPTRRRARLTAVAALVAVALPHMVRPGGLPPWVSAVFLALAGLRASADLRGRRPPARWLVWGLAVLVCAPLPVAYGYRPSRDLFLALLALLVGLKMLEARGLRDWAVAVFLSQFLVLTNLLYSQGVGTAVYLVVVVWLGLVALADLSDRVGAVPARANGRLVLRLLLQALPLTVAVFLLFPRVQGRLWSLPAEPTAGRTGFSEELSPGAVQRVVLSEEVAFRVRFGAGPPPGPWYWRGLVLDRTDGRRWWWEAPGYRDAPAEPAAGSGAVPYTVTLEPHGRRWLFALDLPAQAPAGQRRLSGYQLLAAEPVRERLRYRAESFPRYRTGALSGAERARALAAPPVAPRVAALAAAWRDGAGGDAAVVERALAHYANAGFTYTLSPPATGPAYLEPFLFETRRGFCEQFAGSFAVLMRLAGVPSRVVVGYLGGERNPLGGFWVVRQAQAHAWAEVWLAGRGWVRVDPTAVVQPERLTGLVDNRSGAAGVRYVGPPPDWVRRALRGLRTLRGAVEDTWDQWVLGYDVGRQLRLLRGLGVADPSWRHLAAGLGVCTAAVLAALAALTGWRAVPRGDPAQRAYRRFCARLGRRGLVRQPAEGPLAYARRATAAWPARGREIATITALYVAARYGPGPSGDAVSALGRAVRRFRPGRRPGSPTAPGAGRQGRGECL